MKGSHELTSKSLDWLLIAWPKTFNCNGRNYFLPLFGRVRTRDSSAFKLTLDVSKSTIICDAPQGHPMYVGISGFGWSLIIYQKIEHIDSSKCYQSTAKYQKGLRYILCIKNLFYSSLFVWASIETIPTVLCLKCLTLTLVQLPMGVEVLASIFWKALARILKCIFVKSGGLVWYKYVLMCVLHLRTTIYLSLGKVCFIYIRDMIPHTKKNIILTSAKILGASVFFNI